MAEQTIATVGRSGLSFVPEESGPRVAQVKEMINFISELALNPQVDAAKVEALYNLRRQMLADEAKVTFYRALRHVQTRIPPIEKNGVINLGQGKGSIPFVRWEDMDRMLRPILDEFGFFLTTDMVLKDGGGAVVTTTLHHIDGHTLEASIPLALDSGPGRNNLQSMGSTKSYGLRYTVEMLLRITRKGEDDDGKFGGTKFITPDQADELRELCGQAGRQEGPFLDRLFSGAIRSFDSLEAGSGFFAAKSTLLGIIAQRKKREEESSLRGGGLILKRKQSDEL